MMSDCSITSTLGSCIDLEIVYQDDAGTPEDITDDTFDIYSASRPALTNAVLTITDASVGKVHFHLAPEFSANLANGNINWFRIRRTKPDGCVQVSEQIWINIV